MNYNLSYKKLGKGGRLRERGGGKRRKKSRRKKKKN
jgi:hypothetical protein